MDLPKHWRRLTTFVLDEYLTVHGDKLTDDQADEINEELDARGYRPYERDRQAEADMGLINGVAPQR